MIKFKGIDLRSLGIIVEKTPKISKAKKRINTYEVAGRNGFLSVDTNSYEPFSVVIQCHCLDSADKDKIKEFLDGYGTLELEDGREYTAIINDAIPFEKVMRFKRFQVSFLVNPIAEDKEEITEEIDIEEKNIEGTEIKLENTNITDFKLKGNTYQQTYEGKNLFDKDGLTSAVTIDGTKITMLRSSGWATNKVLLPNIIKAGTILTASRSEYSVTNNAGISIQLFKGDTSVIYLDLVNNSNTQTLPDDVDSYRLTITYNASSNTTGYVKDVQMEVGSNATDYEPYVGGVPSPNPDYPQEIVSVTGLQNVNITGKNLFNFNTFISSSNYAVVDSSTSNSIVARVTQASTWATVRYRIFNLKENTNYSLKYDFENSYNSELYKHTWVVVKNPITGDNIYNEAYYKNDIVTFNTGDNKYLDLLFHVTINAPAVINTLTITNIQLEEGNSVGEYEPYKSNTYEVNLGKNLFDINGEFSSTSPMIKYNNGFQLIKNSGNRTLNYIPSNPIPKGTYTLSYDIVSSTLSDISKLTIQFFNASNTNILTKTLSSTGSLNCILTDDVTKIYFYINNSEATDTQITLDNVQLEKGSQATSYSPYFTPIELNKIGDYQDSIKKSNGKNLFDKSTIKSGYLIQVDGSEVANTSYGASDYIPVKANTQYTRVNCNNYYGAFYDSNKNFVGAIQNANIITPSVDGYVRISFLLTNVDIVMLNDGSTALPYEPYGKVWYVEKKIGKVVLDGSETYTSGSTNTSGVYRIRTTAIANLIKTPSSAGVNGDALSNYFGITTANQNYQCVQGFGVETSGALVFYDSGGNTQTTSAFTTWLSTHNTEVIYQLATPTCTEITNTELIEQLEEIKNLILFDGENNISISSEVLKGIMSFNYVIDKHFINIENASYKSYPIIEIAGKGNVSVNINNNIFYLNNIDGEYILDCKNQVITKDGLNASSNMLGNFPILEIGENKISYSGNITKFNIKYRKAYL